MKLSLAYFGMICSCCVPGYAPSLTPGTDSAGQALRRLGSTTFHLLLQFHPPDGPRVAGTWEREETADGKFEGWVYTYSAHPTARITLVEESAGARRVLSEWPQATGTIRHAT